MGRKGHGITRRIICLKNSILSLFRPIHVPVTRACSIVDDILSETHPLYTRILENFEKSLEFERGPVTEVHGTYPSR